MNSMELLHTRVMAQIKKREARIGIVGLGYVGLPLASAFVGAGFTVTGFDIDATRVGLLARSRSYIRHISDASVLRMSSSGFSATLEMKRLAEMDVVVICVPTPLDAVRQPDLNSVITAMRTVSHFLRPGHLVVLESTTYPGTSRGIVVPLLKESGLRIGKDFFLAYSPEREDPGNFDHSLARLPKVVGGFDEASLQLASALYQPIVARVVPVASLEIAEAAKLLENVYRSVNIALINELKILFDGLEINYWDVIDAAKTKPFGFQSFDPGPGAGGHCIPVDPVYLTWLANSRGLPATIVEASQKVNSAMPGWVVDKVERSLPGRCLQNKLVLLLGAAYKKDVDDVRESPALAIIELLISRGADVRYHDPHVRRLPLRASWPAGACHSIELTAATLQSADCVLVVTDHSIYDWEWIQRHSRFLMSTRRLPIDNYVFA